MSDLPPLTSTKTDQPAQVPVRWNTSDSLRWNLLLRAYNNDTAAFTDLPASTFESGWMRIGPNPSTDFDFEASTDNGRLSITEVLIDSIKAVMVSVTNDDEPVPGRAGTAQLQLTYTGGGSFTFNQAPFIPQRGYNA
jgi:hypothetical protein